MDQGDAPVTDCLQGRPKPQRHKLAEEPPHAMQYAQHPQCQPPIPTSKLSDTVGLPACCSPAHANPCRQPRSYTKETTCMEQKQE